MKVLVYSIAIFAFAAAIHEDDIKEAMERKTDLMNMAVECSAETGLDPESAQKLLLGDFSDDSREARCFVRCFFKKEGFLNEKDVPQTKFIIESLMTSTKLERSRLHYLITKCTRKNKEEDLCDKAFKLLECYVKSQAVRKNVEL